MLIFHKKNLIKIFLLFIFFFLIFLIFYKKKIFPIYKLVCKIEQSSIFYNKQIFSYKPINSLFFNYCYDVLGQVPILQDISIPEKKVLKQKDYSIYSQEKLNYVNNDDWLRSHKNYDSNKIVSYTQINKQNVKNLKKKWEYNLGSTKKNKNIEANPVFFKGNLYFPNLENEIVCLNSFNGKEIWKKKIEKTNRLSYRGLQIDNFKNSLALYVASETGIHVLDLETGKKIYTYKNIESIIPPVITKDSLVVASSSSLVGFKKNSSLIKWEVSTKKNKKERGSYIWGGISYDKKRNFVFATIGSPRFINDFIGINRPGNNLYSNSVVAVDASNGNIKWYFQDTMHDLWDLDLSFPPLLTSLRYKKIFLDVVIVASKSGKVFILERSSGKSLFDYDFVEVPASSIPGEKTSRYQIKTIFPKTLTKFDIEEKELSNISLEINEFVKNKFKEYESGFYLPPKINKKILFRGISGGAQWFGGVVNKEGILFLPINHIPWELNITTFKREKNKLISIKKLKENKDIILKHEAEFFVDQYNNYGTAPPWGTLHAIDLEKQKILWERPFGNSVVKLNNKENTIVAGSDIWGGIILTESNLIIATGSADSKIYFYDSNNGNEIHSIQMESPGSSPPISYMVNNEQFISVVATGGGRTMGAGNKIYGYNLQNE